MMSRIVRACMVLVAVSACASGGSSSAASTEGSLTPATGTRDVISKSELTTPSVQSLNVLDAVRTLRPQFLAERGKNSGGDSDAGKVHASIDNGRVGPLSDLSSVQANSVIEIRYLTAAQAMQKFGGQAHEGPVIVVRTQ
ncbi:MAG: hypothetical protein ABJE10_14940 [bacterium]